MDKTFTYLLQSARLITSNRHTKDNVDFINDLLLSLDNETIIRYFNTKTVNTIGCDYNLFVKLCKFIIHYYENNEEYEKCDKLKNKMNESEDIIKLKTI
jgi:hypothetical protein